MKNRIDIDKAYTWDLDAIYSDPKDWDKDLLKLKQLTSKALGFKGTLGTPEGLLAYYDYTKQLEIVCNRLELYAYLGHSIDIDNDEYNKKLAVLDMVLQQYSDDMAWVAPELNSYDVKYLQGLLEDDRFQLHRMEINDLIKHKPHILSEEVELAVSKVGNFSGAFSDIFEAYDGVDIKFDDALDSKGEAHKVTISNYSTLIQDHDRTLRRNAYFSLRRAFENVSTTLANNYIASVKKDVFYSDIYRYPSALAAKLDGDDVTEDVYYKVIDSVNKHLDIYHDWISLRKQVLGLDEIHPYDLSVPFVEERKRYTFDEAKDIVRTALGVLGDEYIEGLDKIYNNRQIDVYPTKNKTTGGFCVSVYGLPPYVLLNYEDEYDDVSTLAHECGHAMHHNMVAKYQPYEYNETGTFLAEIASTTNEVILTKYMYNHTTDKDEKKYILQQYIGTICGTLITQTMFSEFENYAHRRVENKEPLTKEDILSYYAELTNKYNGGLVVMEDATKYDCLRIPHFYRRYYVYTYATGITTAINFAKGCETKEGVDRYLKFLQAGGSNYPLEILRDAGIDLATDQPYDVIFGELKWAIDELRALVK